jgi:hypothetical protein
MAPMSADYEKALWIACRAFLRAAVPDAPLEDISEAFSGLAAAALARAEALGKSPPPGCVYRDDLENAADAVFELVREGCVGRNVVFTEYIKHLIDAAERAIEVVPAHGGWQS